MAAPPEREASDQSEPQRHPRSHVPPRISPVGSYGVPSPEAAAVATMPVPIRCPLTSPNLQLGVSPDQEDVNPSVRALHLLRVTVPSPLSLAPRACNASSQFRTARHASSTEVVTAIG